MLERMERTVIKEALSGGKGRENLNNEVKWRPLCGGAEGDESLIEEVKRRHCWWSARGRKV